MFFFDDSKWLEQIWQRIAKGTFLQNYIEIGPEDSDKKFLVKKSILSSCDLDMQWTGTIWTTLKEDQPRIITMKFGQNPISGLGGDVV